MTTEEFISIMSSGAEVTAGSEVHKYMIYLSGEAMKITSSLNNICQTPEEIGELMEKLTGRKFPEGAYMFPPFYTDCGKNLHIGKNVFINACCHFQDQGVIFIGDDTLIGPKVVIATLNHHLDSEKRANMFPKPVKIGKKVWIGANVTILPGVTIGDGAVIAAGAVVSRNVQSHTVVGGVPARVIKNIDT